MYNAKRKKTVGWSGTAGTQSNSHINVMNNQKRSDVHKCIQITCKLVRLSQRDTDIFPRANEWLKMTPKFISQIESEVVFLAIRKFQLKTMTNIKWNSCEQFKRELSTINCVFKSHEHLKETLDIRKPHNHSNPLHIGNPTHPADSNDIALKSPTNVFNRTT